jgi:hypothetical protein
MFAMVAEPTAAVVPEDVNAKLEIVIRMDGEIDSVYVVSPS